MLRLFIYTALFAALHTTALKQYTGPPPSTLPNRQPFGFAEASTGGGGNGANPTFVVENMPDLRSTLKLPGAKIIYINGTIYGNDLYANGSSSSNFGNCQWYIDTSSVKNYNFTLYLLSSNSTYMELVKFAADAGVGFEGWNNASEYRTLLQRQNGWRNIAQNVQKEWETVDVTSDTSLIGWDRSAELRGVNLKLASVDNVHIRNLKITPPRDCFPAPERYPGTWNARYDAISSVTSTNIWIDGNILQDGDSGVEPDPFLNGWLVDRYDGLFDAEDGTDNVTFSHNIIRNHHKSLLLGGGNKEATRDLGKMRFTIFANHFNSSDSRNPLMRFGSFHIQNNLFTSTNNKAPIFTYNAATAVTSRAAGEASSHPFQYHLGVFNQSNVLVSGNVFKQDGAYKDDVTRIFAYSDLTRADIPARLCVKEDGYSSTFNREDVDLGGVAGELFEHYVSESKAVEGGLVIDCAGFVTHALPKKFGSTEEVESYILKQSGQL